MESFITEKGKVERKIKIGRRRLLVLVPAHVIFFAAYIHFNYSDYSRDGKNEVMNQWDYVIGYVLYLLFVLLFVCVIRLISLLKRMRDLLFVNQKDQIDFFNKEIRTLWIILIAFNSSYLIRGLWDQFTS